MHSLSHSARRDRGLARPEVGSIALATLTALYLIAVTNRTFFTRAYAYFDNHLPLAAFALGITCLFAAFTITVSVKYLIKPMLIIMVLSAASASWFMDGFGTIIDVDMIRNAATTTTSEAGHLITPAYLLHMTVFGIVPSLVICWVRVRHRNFFAKVRWNLVAILPLVLVALACGVSSARSIAAVTRLHKDLMMTLNPFAPVGSAIKFALASEADSHVVAGPIATSVNLLMSRLRSALDAEREFTSNSAHELRKPIAGALAQTQMLISELREPAARHRAGQIEASLTRLSHLAEKLLQLSRAEAGIGIGDKPVDLMRVLDMVLTDFWRGMADPRRLVLHRAEDVSLVGPFSEDAFAIVLRNLIENALVHGDPDRKVDVFVDDAGMIRIVNGSPLLTDSELSEIRKRFGRVRTTAMGSGLGLSIVDRLLGQMNAELVLQSPATGSADGFEARIRFKSLT